MWWKRNKLQQLYGELSAIAASDMRRRRQSELLAEMARLDPTAVSLSDRD